MDPNANLEEQRRLVAEINAARDGTGDDSRVETALYRLAELAEALDQWITHGGFLPAAWTAHATRTPYRDCSPSRDPRTRCTFEQESIDGKSARRCTRMDGHPGQHAYGTWIRR